MAQVTIYIDAETDKKLGSLIADKNISKSKWISELIREQTRTQWPDRIKSLAGAWQDIPVVDELRKTKSLDAKRESF